MYKLLNFLALCAIKIFWGGYVLAVLWGWFVVPLGVASIPFGQAAGISVLLLVALGSRGIDYDKKSEATHVALLATLLPAMGLGLGWLAHVAMLCA